MYLKSFRKFMCLALVVSMITNLDCLTVYAEQPPNPEVQTETADNPAETESTPMLELEESTEIQTPVEIPMLELEDSVVVEEKDSDGNVSTEGSITSTESEISMTVGEEYQLDYIVDAPEYLRPLIWSVSDESVVDVSVTGLVTAKRLGTAEISASLDNGSKVTWSVKVNSGKNAIEGIAINSIRETVFTGDTFDCSVEFLDVTDREILKTAKVINDTPDILFLVPSKSLSTDILEGVRVEADKVGVGRFRVIAGGISSKTIEVNVTDYGVTADLQKLSLNCDESRLVTIKTRYATSRAPEIHIQHDSSLECTEPEEFVEVKDNIFQSSFIVTAKSKGDSMISLMDSQDSIEFLKIPVSIKESADDILVGSSIRFASEYYSVDAPSETQIELLNVPAELKDTISWSVSCDDMSISDTGLLSVTNEEYHSHTPTVTATLSNGESYSVKIHFNSTRAVQKYKNITLTKGESQKLDYVLYLSSQSDSKDISFEVSDPSVISIDGNKLTGINSGFSTVELKLQSMVLAKWNILIQDDDSNNLSNLNICHRVTDSSYVHFKESILFLTPNISRKFEVLNYGNPLDYNSIKWEIPNELSDKVTIFKDSITTSSSLSGNLTAILPDNTKLQLEIISTEGPQTFNTVYECQSLENLRVGESIQIDFTRDDGALLNLERFRDSVAPECTVSDDYILSAVKPTQSFGAREITLEYSDGTQFNTYFSVHSEIAEPNFPNEYHNIPLFTQPIIQYLGIIVHFSASYGDTGVLNVINAPTNDDTIKWYSSSDAIEINPSGYFKIVKNVEEDISVVAVYPNGEFVNTELYIQKIPLEVSQSEYKIYFGEKITIEPKINVFDLYSYENLSPKILKVNELGQVTGIGLGKGRVKVVSDSESITIPITVLKNTEANIPNPSQVVQLDELTGYEYGSNSHTDDMKNYIYNFEAEEFIDSVDIYTLKVGETVKLSTNYLDLPDVNSAFSVMSLNDLTVAEVDNTSNTLVAENPGQAILNQYFSHRDTGVNELRRSIILVGESSRPSIKDLDARLYLSSSSPTANYFIGSEHKLNLVWVFNGGYSNVNVPRNMIKYSLSNPDIASIIDNKILRLEKAGSTTLTATLSTGQTFTEQIDSFPNYKIYDDIIKLKSIVLCVGDILNTSNIDILDILGFTPQKYNFVLNPNNIADFNTKTKEITARKAGTRDLFLRFRDEDYVWNKETLLLSIVKAKVSLSAEELYINPKESKKLNATITPIKYESDIYWYSEDERVATVNSNGVVTGITSGDTYIVAGIKDSMFKKCKIHVTGEKVTLDPEIRLSKSLLPDKDTANIHMKAFGDFVRIKLPDNSYTASHFTDFKVSENGTYEFTGIVPSGEEIQKDIDIDYFKDPDPDPTPEPDPKPEPEPEHNSHHFHRHSSNSIDDAEYTEIYTLTNCITKENPGTGL